MFGEAPDWYRLIRAAKYLGVPPWDLADKPVWWMEIALAGESAENAAQAHEDARRKRRGVSHANGG